MEWLAQYLRKEGRVIRRAPVAFTICVLIVAALGIGGASWVLDIRYRDRLELANNRAEFNQELVAEYREKLNVGSPDTAAKKMKALEAQIAALEARAQPRSLTPDQFAKLVEAAKSVCPIEPKVLVAANILTDHEAESYALRIVDALEISGCIVEMSQSLKPLGNLVGEHIGVRDLNNIHPGAQQLYEILSIAGVKIKIDLKLRPDDFSEVPFVLAVGAKSNVAR